MDCLGWGGLLQFVSCCLRFALGLWLAGFLFAVLFVCLLAMGYFVADPLLLRLVLLLRFV